MFILLQIKKFNKCYNKTFNIGGGIQNSISLKELTKKCEKITKNKLKIIKKKKTSIFDIPYYITDNSKIKKYYHWKPVKNIDQIIKDVYNWLNNNYFIRKHFK